MRTVCGAERRRQSNAVYGAGGLGMAGLDANWFVPITWAEACTRDRLT